MLSGGRRWSTMLPVRRCLTRRPARSLGTPPAMWLALAVAIFAAGSAASGVVAEPLPAAPLEAGFAEADITPALDPARPVWIAGYGMGRRATGVHDPLRVRAVVLRDGTRKFALACVDLVGLQYPETKRIRARLPEFAEVMVSSTHNHEGPDVIGIWGANPLQRGADDRYLSLVVDRVVEAIRAADKAARPAEARYGEAEDESLVGDSRLPKVKDGKLRVVRFDRVRFDRAATPAADAPAKVEQSSQATAKPLGLLVVWTCHPEAMGSRNTLLTADFVAATVAKLSADHGCPVAYFSGAVGGLMAPPDNRIRDSAGRVLQEGDFAYSDGYGEAVAALANQALERATPIRLTPLAAATERIAIPVENKLYRAARAMGVLQRQMLDWTGEEQLPPDPVGVSARGNSQSGSSQSGSSQSGSSPSDESKSGKAERKAASKATGAAVETEVGLLQLGELAVACIPGEIYPELVYGAFQEPVEPQVDFPNAPKEPTVAGLMPGPRWLLMGLANDEVGYILPKRQWDERPPYAYGRDKPQYGEINSCGPDAAPIILRSLARCAQRLKPPPAAP